MFKLLGITLYVGLALVTLTWGARTVGQMQPIPQSITQLHLTDCAPPCWIGIIPGSTTVREAKARITTVFGVQSQLTIKDSGFADGYVAPNAVENMIEGANFHLLVRLNISELVDGESEPVQSIDLYQSQGEGRGNPPTVVDILAVFGAPKGVAAEKSMSAGYDVTLNYRGLDVVFHSSGDRPSLSEYPRLYLGNFDARTPSGNYRPWIGLHTLTLLQ